MGGKRSRAGKLVYICFAGLILLLQPGCAYLEGVWGRDEGRQALARAQRLLAQGDYDASLEENQKALSVLGRRPPADEALFNMGLVHANGANPKRDARKAAALLRQLIRDHPQSSFAEPAKVFLGILDSNEKLGQTNEKLGQANERLSEIIKRFQQVDIEIERKKREKER